MRCGNIHEYFGRRRETEKKILRAINIHLLLESGEKERKRDSDKKNWAMIESCVALLFVPSEKKEEKKKRSRENVAQFEEIFALYTSDTLEQIVSSRIWGSISQLKVEQNGPISVGTLVNVCLEHNVSSHPIFFFSILLFFSSLLFLFCFVN